MGKTVRRILASVLTAVMLISAVPLGGIESLSGIFKAEAVSSLQSEEYLNRLKSKTNKDVVEYKFDDFDNDSNYEMFVLVGSESSVYDWCIYGDLYYIDSKSVTQLITNRDFESRSDGYHGDYNLDNYIVVNTVCSRKFIMVNTVPGNYTKTYVYTVVDGSCLKTNLSEIGGFKYKSDEFAIGAVYTTFDASFDGTGRTWKDYYFYWDETTHSFKEYGGITVTRNQLSKVDGANEILTKIDSYNYTIKNIYFRANGIVNINFTYFDEYGFGSNDNVNLKYDYIKKKLCLLNNSYWKDDNELLQSSMGGVYSASITSVATYPSELLDLMDWYKVDASNSLDLYKSVLNQYVYLNEELEKVDLNNVANRGFEVQACNDFVDECVYDSMRYSSDYKIYYAFYDIDKNGVEEILLCSSTSNGSSSPNVIITYSAGKINKLDAASYRSSLWLFNNGVVMRDGSGGADYHGWTLSKIASDGKSLESFYEFACDSSGKETIYTNYDNKVSYDEVNNVFKKYIGIEIYNSYSSSPYLVKPNWHLLKNISLSEPSSDKNGMQIVINNTSLAYYEGDDILIAVSNLKNGVENAPGNLSIKVSNSKVVSNAKIYDYSDLPSPLHIIEELKNYKIIYLKANGIGTASVSITDSDTGENRVIAVTVSKDNLGGYRATDVGTHLYDNGWEQDYYNGYSGGIWISDFEYEKVSGGYNFSMNCYNENYCSGVIEVYNADGKLINAREIEKFESLTKGIYECFKAGYTIIKDAVDGDILSFRSDSTAKCTPIEDLFVPQDGHILVTADSSISTTCSVINVFDMIFTGWSMADDVASIVKGVQSLSKDQINQLKLSVLAKLISQEEYLNFGKEFQEKIVEEGAKELTINGINTFVSRLMIDAEQLLEDMNWSFDGLLKTALGTGAGIAEGVFEKCAGPFGLTLKGMFLIQDVMDYICQIHNFGKQMTGKSPFGCYTPVKGTPSGVLKNSDVTIDTNGNTSPETVLQSYQILKGDSYQIDLNSGKVLNEFELYEIALHNSGQEVQPDGKVTVYIKSPYETALVARQNEDGSWQLIDSRMENGMVVFDVDHFCQFVVFDVQQGKVNSVSVDDIEMNYKKTATLNTVIDIGEWVNYTVEYSSSDPSVVKVDENGKIYGAKKGSADITVTVTDEFGNTTTDTCNVKVKYSFGQWLIVILLFGWIWY